MYHHLILRKTFFGNFSFTVDPIMTLCTFGCLCYPLMCPYNSHKLQPRSGECVFLGYATNAKGYLCCNIHTRKYYTSRHVIFTESLFPFHKSSSVQTPILSTWLNTNLSFHTCPLTPIFGSGPVVSSTPSILGPHPTLSNILTLDHPSLSSTSHSSIRYSTYLVIKST